MYKTIYVPVDNSDYSNLALDVGVSLAKTFGAKLVGSHVYAAKMHDKRFKQMEAGLPEEYHDEKELDRQRQIHDSLITRGLQIITDSYLDYVDKKCNEANLPIERRSLEGRNWKVLAEDINTNAYDLVIMGALGVGAVKDSVIGSNTERVLRRVRNSDMLIIKQTQPMTGGKIVVAVDGSPYSFGGLMTGLTLGKAFEKIIQYVRKDIPALLIVGRIGVHSDEDMDIGSNTENLLRSAPCNILVSNRKYVPPIDTLAEYTIAWTEEALRRMEKIPIFARGVAKTAIHRYAIEKGHTIISNTVVDTAIGHILPKGAMDAMRALGGSLDAAGIDRDKMQADESVMQDLMGSTLSGMMTEIVEEKPKVSANTQAYLDRMTQNYFVCDGCGYIGKGETPVK